VRPNTLKRELQQSCAALPVKPGGSIDLDATRPARVHQTTAG
jgi:hypothetical protein